MKPRAFFGPAEPELAQELAQIAYAPVCMLQVGVEQQQLPRALAGFGFLAPPAASLPILGAVFDSQLFPGRAPAGCELISVFAGGRGRAELLAEHDDTELAALLLDGLAVALSGTRSAGASPPTELLPRVSALRRLERAIPQYELGHHARVARMEALLESDRTVQLAGNYLHGVSLNHAAISGIEAAEAIPSLAPPQ